MSFCKRVIMVGLSLALASCSGGSGQSGRMLSKVLPSEAWWTMPQHSRRRMQLFQGAE